MRNRTVWLAPALVGALVLVGAAAVAQPPDKAPDQRGGPPRGFGGRGGPRGAFPPGLTVDQIVERIMAFDKNKDGKVTKDELPERMQDLIAKGLQRRRRLRVGAVALQRDRHASDRVSRVDVDVDRARHLPAHRDHGQGV